MAVVYVVLTLLLAYPLTMHPADAVMSAGTDTNLYMWTLAWDAHAFVHQPFSIFDANIFYPFRHTLAYSENLIGSALLAAPVYWLTHNPVLTMNVADLITVPLCGLGAYVLARRLGIGPGGAALSGLVYAFAPPRFLRLDQAHLTAVEWIPFSLAYAHAYLDTGRRRDLHLAIGFFTLQVLTSGHGAVFLTSALLGLIAFRLALGGRLAPASRVRDLGAVGLLLLLPSILMIVPYQTVQAQIGLRRTLEGWDMSAVSFLASPTHVHQFIASRLFPHARINEEAWAYLFPGYLPLLLAAAAFVRPGVRSSARSEQPALGRGVAWRRLALALELAALLALALSVYVTIAGAARVKLGTVALLSARRPWRAWLVCLAAFAARAAIVRRAPLDVGPRLRGRADAWRRWSAAARRDMRLFYLATVLACLWLSIGPPYGIWQYVYWLPGLNFVRAPSRFMILGVLALGVLSGFGVDRMSARLGSAGRALL